MIKSTLRLGCTAIAHLTKYLINNFLPDLKHLVYTCPSGKKAGFKILQELLEICLTGCEYIYQWTRLLQATR